MVLIAEFPSMFKRNYARFNLWPVTQNVQRFPQTGV